MKLYIAVLDEFPDFMTPTLVAHGVLGAHLKFHDEYAGYDHWIEYSYKKCVVRVNQKEFDKIAELPGTYLGYEKNTLDGRHSVAIPVPVEDDKIPNVLEFAKLWKPKV